MKKVLLLLSLLLFAGLYAQGQQRRITGTVTDASDNTTLIGVTVMIKGTTQGTTTDIDGRYEITASPADILVFRFIGMVTREVLIVDQRVIDIAMEPEVATLEQVVVTALGIKREERQLTYNVQSIQSDEIVSSRQENLVNALQGRVSGVQISSTSGAPGASSEIILRGATSVDGENQPLFVIDGVPISNASVRGTTNRAADINPSDIESISILKGAAAAALYGIDAANGAIIITTRRGQEGAVRVGLSSSTTVSQVGALHEVQNTYTTGANGIFNPRTFTNWGPLYRRSDAIYDNLGNFFQNGVSTKFDANVSGGSDKLTYYLAVSDLGDQGIVPNTQYGRNSALLTGSLKITDRISLTTSSNIIKSKNTYGIVSASGGWMAGVYRWPRWDNIKEIYNPDGTERNIWIPVSGNLADAPDNPLWIANHNLRNDKVDRTINSLNFSYNVTDWFTINYIAGRDFFLQHFKAVSEWGSAGSAHEGAISEFNRESEKLTSTILATVDRQITEKLRVSVMAGNNIQTDFARNSNIEGEKFRNPFLHSTNNLQEVRTNQATARRRIIGVFGDVTIDYGRFIVFGLTGRNDWSSTLPRDNRSFFYPSYSFAFIPSELIEGGPLKDIFSFAKIRASYAQVGKDAPPHRLAQTLDQFYGINGGWKLSPFAGNPILRPEITTEMEIGTDIRLWNGLFNIDFTYYQRVSDDQIITPRVTPVTGAILQTVNSGSVENKGMELLIKTRMLRSHDFDWDFTTNLFGNRSKLTKLFGDLVEFPVTYGQVSSQAIASSWLGQPLFGIVGTDYRRTDDGRVIIGSNGYPLIDSEKRYIGNREPRLYYGFNNNFRYKSFEFSFLIDGAYGAEILNATSQFLLSSGNHSMIPNYRNQEFIFDGVVQQSDGSYAPNTKEVILDRDFFNNIYLLAGTNFVEQVYWVRLRNVNFGFNFPERWISRLGMKEAVINLTFQNLYLLTNYSGGDPEVNNAGPGGGASGAGTMGVDYFQVPHRKAVTMGLNLRF